MKTNELSPRHYDRFPGALTVTQLNEYVKQMVDHTPELTKVLVKGEISNFKNHYSTGHFYFTLKDEGGQLRSVMFKSSAVKLSFMPEDGMKVIAGGRISVFVRDGTYQLYCDSLEPDGVGALYIAYEQLKKRLEEEGLFDPERKKPIPKIPSRVGIITSATGAAIRDMINVTGRRFPFAKIILYPALVQGSDAPPQLIAGIKHFNRTKSADVIIIGRGGGSIEDLWAFNDESLARAVAASEIPVISAVGHETDFTICDFVADKRAPTPSAAAELAVPDTADLKRKISNIVTREGDVLLAMIRFRRDRLNILERTRAMTDPMNFVGDRRIALDALDDRLTRAESTSANMRRADLAGLSGKLGALDPLAVLARGYSAIYKDDGSLVRSINDVKAGDSVEFKTVGGSAICSVDKIKKEKKAPKKVKSENDHE